MAERGHDVIVIGAGHNGLTAAAYLARAGLAVLVLERLDKVGGACTTDEVFPGFFGPMCAYNCYALQDKVVRDLRLRRHGFEVIPIGGSLGGVMRFQPFPDGTHLGGPGIHNAADIARDIARLSQHDARAYPAWDAFWQDATGILHPYLLREPPTLAELMDGVRGTRREQVLEKMLTWSLADLVCEQFEDERVRAAMVKFPECDPGAVGSVMSCAMLRAIGAFVRDEERGIPRGGMGALSEALAASARGFGADIRTGAPVARVIVEGGVARGVRMADGSEMRARVVVSNADPKRTFTALLSAEDAGAHTLRNAHRWKTRAGCIKFLAALRELPDFSAYLGNGYRRESVVYVVIKPSFEYLERSWDEAASGLPSTHPVMHIQIPSIVEPALTPRGGHFLTNWVLYYPPTPAEGTWDDHRRRVGEMIIDVITEYAPNFRRSIMDWTLQTPTDMEARVGLTDGNIRHLDMVPRQLLSQRRPYATHIRGLYLCGSGTHPAGEVTAAPGHNAAHAILRDLARPPGA